jgi:hypothetical protein
MVIRASSVSAHAVPALAAIVTMSASNDVCAESFAEDRKFMAIFPD